MIGLATAEPLRLWRCTVLPEWQDYNGHMTEYRYLQVFGEASDRLYERLGIDFARAGEGAYFTRETHIRHLAECRAGTELVTETEVLAYDEKRLHLFHRLADRSGVLLATAEHLSIHVRRSRSAPASDAVLAAVGAIFEAQSTLPIPPDTGSVLTRPLRHRRGSRGT